MGYDLRCLVDERHQYAEEHAPQDGGPDVGLASRPVHAIVAGRKALFQGADDDQGDEKLAGMMREEPAEISAGRYRQTRNHDGAVCSIGASDRRAESQRRGDEQRDRLESETRVVETGVGFGHGQTLGELTASRRERIDLRHAEGGDPVSDRMPLDMWD